MIIIITTEYSDKSKTVRGEIVLEKIVTEVGEKAFRRLFAGIDIIGSMYSR